MFSRSKITPPTPLNSPATPKSKVLFQRPPRPHQRPQGVGTTDPVGNHCCRRLTKRHHHWMAKTTGGGEKMEIKDLP